LKELFIIRHAKSSWESDFIKDIDRPLNKRGEKDAPEIGKQLKKRGEVIDQFLSSNAKRAIITARNAAEKFGYPIDDIITEDAIYEANVNKLIKIICSIEDKNKSAAIFGHNPGFTELAEYLTDELIGNIPTAGIVKIKLEVSSWKEVSSNTGSLVYFIYPKGNTE
jgi:phosphohistidine phosphatase